MITPSRSSPFRIGTRRLCAIAAVRHLNRSDLPRGIPGSTRTSPTCTACGSTQLTAVRMRLDYAACPPSLRESRGHCSADASAMQLAIEQMHRAEDSTTIRVAFSHRVEHRLQVGRRPADDLQHLGGGGLLLERLLRSRVWPAPRRTAATFSIAITAWSAKVRSSLTWWSANDPARSRVTLITPIAFPLRIKGQTTAATAAQPRHLPQAGRLVCEFPRPGDTRMHSLSHSRHAICDKRAREQAISARIGLRTNRRKRLR